MFPGARMVHGRDSDQFRGSFVFLYSSCGRPARHTVFSEGGLDYAAGSPRRGLGVFFDAAGAERDVAVWRACELRYFLAERKGSFANPGFLRFVPVFPLL